MGRRLPVTPAGITDANRQTSQNSGRNRSRRRLRRDKASPSTPGALPRSTALATTVRQLPEGSIAPNHP